MNHVNSLAERQDQLFSIRRGKPVRNRVRGRGKYKSFTAKTMLKSAFLCFGMAQLSCKVNLQLHKDREVASLAVCSKVRHMPPISAIRNKSALAKHQTPAPCHPVEQHISMQQKQALGSSVLFITN